MSFSNSTLDSAKDLFKKKYNLGGILPSPDSPEVKKVLGAFCDSKRINGNSGDYLGSLDRELNRNGRLSLCSDSKKMLGSGDTILSMVSKLRSGATFKPDEIASNFIGSELNAMGFQGKVPSCLMDKVLESLKGSFGLPGGLIPKLDMSGLLGDKCIRDSPPVYHVNKCSKTNNGIFKLPPVSKDNKKMMYYLKNKRKIDKEVIQFYYQKGMIYECSYDHSVVFVGYDEKGIPRHAHKRGLYTVGNGYKGNIGSVKNFVLLPSNLR